MTPTPSKQLWMARNLRGGEGAGLQKTYNNEGVLSQGACTVRICLVKAPKNYPGQNP